MYKVTFFFKRFCFIAIVFLLTSCNDKLNEVLIGEYHVSEYKPESIKVDSVTPVLSLFKNNEFKFQNKEIKLTGKWDARETSDWTLITFYFEGSTSSDASIGGSNFELINIWNPSDFNFKNLTKVTFKKFK